VDTSVLWYLMLCAWATLANARPASYEEAQMLFDLATTKPQRLWVVAEIHSNPPSSSHEQIAAEIAHQNELYPDLEKLPEAQQRARTNAIARSRSGDRILHVREWYSGDLYRLDQTDEGMVSDRYLEENPGEYRNTFVNIDDEAISPYRSYFVDHHLRDAQLSKTKRYAKNDLWRAAGLEGELSFPIIVALVDSESLPAGRAFTDDELAQLRMDPSKAERLIDGSNPRRRLEVLVDDSDEDRLRFTLRGRFVSPDGTPAKHTPDRMSDVEFVYVLERSDQQMLCVEASFTNHTGHSSLISRRAEFDPGGFPRVWERTTIKPDSARTRIKVIFKEVDLNPSFSDEEVFSTQFPTNYIVSDVTSGRAQVLQKPLDPVSAPQPLAELSPVRRKVIISVLVLTAVIGPVVVLLHLKRNKAENPS